MKLFQKIRQFGPLFWALILVALVLLFSAYHRSQYLKLALEKESQIVLDRLAYQLEDDVQHLSLLKRFYISSDFMSRHQFDFFSHQILAGSSQILALGWVPQVPEEQRQKYTDLALQDGLETFLFKRWTPLSGWEKQSQPWARHYFPIFYMQPLATNQTMLGLDLGSYKETREAIDEALKSNQVVASEVVEFAEIGQVIFVFLSAENQQLEPVNRQQAQGLVLATIKVSDYFETLMHSQKEKMINLVVRENNAQGQILYSTNQGLEETALVTQVPFSFLNQNWHLSVSAGEGFYALYDNNSHVYIFIAGIIFLLLVFKYNLMAISKMKRIESNMALNIDNAALKKQDLDYNQFFQKTILDLVPDSIITIDGEGIVGEFNAAAEAMFGYQKAEILGNNIKCLMPKSFSQAHDGYLLNYKKTGVRHIIGSNRDVMGKHRDGTTFPLNLSVSEINMAGDPIFVGLLRHVTQEQDKAIRLRAMFKQLRSILNATNEGICSINADGIIQFANRAAEDILGYEKNGLDGVNFKDLIQEDNTLEVDDEDIESSFTQCLREDVGIVGLTEMVVTSEGQLLSVNISLCPTNDLSEADFVIVFTDNAENVAASRLIKEQYRALDVANAQLNRANKDMEQFAYVASHDLKAPLRAISHLAGWVCEDLGDALTGESLENMTLLRSRVSRLDQLLTDLLTYSKTSRAYEEKQDINSEQITRDLIDLQGVPKTIEVVVTSDLPMVHSNRVAFELVLRNLISNAIKHGKSEGGRVEISAQVFDTETIFSVTDNGAGIRLEDHEKIFELFTKLQTNDDVEGSGMGLSICRRAVDHIGGRLWIDPELTLGARFSFSIPKAV